MGEDGDPGRGGLSRFALGGGGGYFRIGAAGADGIEVTWDKLGDTGVATIGKVGGFPGVGMGFGESGGVSVTDVIYGVDPGEVWVESGSVVFGSSWGGGFIFGFGGNRKGGAGVPKGGGGGQC